MLFSAHPFEPWHLASIRDVCDRYLFVHNGRLSVMHSYDEFMRHPDVVDYMSALAFATQLTLCTTLSLRHFLLALAVVAVWGTNFVVIKLGQMPPLLFATLRFAVAVVPFCFPRPRVLGCWRMGC